MTLPDSGLGWRPPQARNARLEFSRERDAAALAAANEAALAAARRHEARRRLARVRAQARIPSRGFDFQR